MKLSWSFEREARWMLWMLLLPAAVGVLLALVIPSLSRWLFE